MTQTILSAFRLSCAAGWVATLRVPYFAGRIGTAGIVRAFGVPSSGGFGNTRPRKRGTPNLAVRIACVTKRPGGDLFRSPPFP